MDSNYYMKINEKEAYECLKMIRTAPGKIYEYELYHKINRPELANCDAKVAQMINDFFELDFAICDTKESSHNKAGLNVIYTNPKYRLVLDLLLSHHGFDLDRTVYIDYTEETIEKTKATIRVHYTTPEKKLNEMLREHPKNFYISKAIEIFKSWPQVITMDVMTVEDIAKDYSSGTLNLANKFIIDFNYDRLAQILKTRPVFKNLNANGAFFAVTDSQEKIDFSNALFSGTTTFKGCIFKGNTLTFEKSQIQLSSTENRDDQTECEFSFRNSRFLVKELYFDEVICDGLAEKKILSFEDAVIDALHISFSKMDLNNTELFCYQTIMVKANITFIETRMENSLLDFEDSAVDKINMLNISFIPEAIFNFRHCRELIIENCNIEKNITLIGMETLSLRNCRNQGKILTNWEDKTKDKQRNKNFPIILAVINNSDDDFDKAEQFLLLKESFQEQGQYYYEDEAFIQYMIFKHKKSRINFIYTFLRIIGEYGISPLRILITMLVVLLFFTGLNLFSSYLVPNAFSFNPENFSFLNIVAKSFYISIANLVSYDSGFIACHIFTIISSVLESITGWFLLGYLSVAVVRKTLR